MIFSRKHAEHSRTNDPTSLIANHTHLQGDICFSGSLYLEGSVEGIVYADDAAAVLTLSEHGLVRGDIRVPIAVIHGEVRGNVYVADRLELAATARITGDVYYRMLKMTAGAQVNGCLYHQTLESTYEPPAPVLLIEPETSTPGESVNHLMATGTFESTNEPVTFVPSEQSLTSGDSRRERRRRRTQGTGV